VRERDGPAGHVFISYVRENSRDVDLLQQTLESAGVRVWRDTADLWPGEDWRVKIRQAITADALVFVACFSRASNAREVSYQNEELILAIEQLRRRRPEEPWLIPVRFDDCEIPELDLGAGRTLASIQRADLFGGRYHQDGARLVATVLRILERGSARAGFSAAGQETFVASKPEPFVTTLSDGEAAARLLAAGASSARAARTSPPRVEILPASARLASQLHIDEGAQVVSRHQQRWIDETPWSLQTSFYPMAVVRAGATRLLQAEDISEGTSSYLDEVLAIRQVSLRDEIEVRMPDMDESVFFGLRGGGTVPVLEVSRTARTEDGVPVRFTVTVFLADRNRVAYEHG
jgi:DNA-binding GntR family transcriptional regulator